MSPGATSPFLLRLLAGFIGSVAAGAAAFGLDVFEPALPSFQAVAMGFLTAAVLSTVLSRQALAAIGVVLGFSLLQAIGYAGDTGARAFTVPAWSLCVGLGTIMVAIVFDRLAAEGYRFGKFLLTGPLLAGVFVAATPLAVMGGPSSTGLTRNLALNAFMGLLIGDSVGFGVEIVDWLRLPRPAPLR